MGQRRRMAIGGLVVGLAVLWAAALVRAGDEERRPTDQEVEFARQVSDLLLNELVAALFTEFDETTPENVPHGKQAISLIFNDLNRDIRLVGALPPLLGGANNRAADAFERMALQRALAGEATAAVQRVNDTWTYRRTIPLSNTFHAACVLCHTNFTPDRFGPDNPGQWTGALALSVPIRTNRDDDD